MFTEFKDRFRIRKLLRDIGEKNLARPQPTAAASQNDHGQKWKDSILSQESAVHHVSRNMEAASSALLSLSSTEGEVSRKRISSPHTSGIAADEEITIKEESDDSSCVKRQRVMDVEEGPTIPAAHSNSYNVLQSRSLRGFSPSTVESFISPSPASLFLSMPDFLSPFMMAHPLLSSTTGLGKEQRKATAGAGCEEQALCLKKSPQRSAPSPQARSEAASPATQPSSTTPDYLSGLDTPHLDFASVMSMGHLAAKFSAQEILSKKGQRSRPNNAQKLGSILIRTAAQQANLWSAPPHLRSISQPQKQEFLRCVYHVAPHIREYEHLLWQRLSETLQNRRKYLLDKKLGKRGFSSSGQPASSSSTAFHQDFPEFSDRHMASMQSHLARLGEGVHADVNAVNEAAASPDSEQIRPIKTEPDP